MMDLIDTVYEEETVEGMQAEKGHEHKEEDAHEDADSHDKEDAHEEYDEHVWTSIDNAVSISEAICKTLADRQPGDRDYIEKNYEEYNESELFNYTFEDKTDYILVTNKNTKDSIKLEFNNLSGFFILKNVNKYTIIAYTNDGYNSEIYYSSFITENNMSNDRGYLNEIKDSFNKYDLPSIIAGGYLTFKNDDYKYPYFIGSTPNHFMLDMNDKLYMIKGED